MFSLVLHCNQFTNFEMAFEMSCLSRQCNKDCAIHTFG
jgi:hypothetical protein